MQPKSSITIPGHLDPQFGTYQTDAPTTSWVAVQVAVTLAASLGMFGETLDGSAASLSGMPLGSPIHVKSTERWCTGSW